MEKTLREYFTKHPQFKPNGKFEVADEKKQIVRYCGVPLDSACWDLLKKDKLDTPVPAASLAVLSNY